MDQMYVQNHMYQMAHATVNLDVNMAIMDMIVEHATLNWGMKMISMKIAIVALNNFLLHYMILMIDQNVKVNIK